MGKISKIRSKKFNFIKLENNPAKRKGQTAITKYIKEITEYFDILNAYFGSIRSFQ
jgi:hypothetical protein